MKIISFGSLNIDRVYDVSHIVTPGETITAGSMNTYAGGKGLNQSIAAARAGADVIHTGAIGTDGDFLVALLAQSGVNTEAICHLPTSSGHAIIQVTPEGQNAIIVYGGANQMLTPSYIVSCLDMASEGDYVLLQNETNEVAFIISEAAKRHLHVVFNPSPFPTDLQSLPLNDVSVFIVNEIEGAQLANADVNTAPDKILDLLSVRYPNADIVLTLGSQGVVCHMRGTRYQQEIFNVPTVDTTAAGDTFCGYFLADQCLGMSVPDSLRHASAAAAIAVTKAGAAPSIPTADDVECFLKKR